MKHIHYNKLKSINFFNKKTTMIILVVFVIH